MCWVLFVGGGGVCGLDLVGVAVLVCVGVGVWTVVHITSNVCDYRMGVCDVWT